MALIDQTGLRGKTRDMPICSELEGVLLKAADAVGVDIVRLTSGGQPGSTGKRTGSTRHDGGRAADLQLVKTGRTLTFTDEAPDPVLEAFVVHAAANGATGIGAGVHYMNDQTMHVGFGRDRQDQDCLVWGAGGHSKTAPRWLRAAAEKGWKLRGRERPTLAATQEVSSTVSNPVSALLDFIASFEAPKGYDQLYNNGQRFIPRKLTSMTLDEVLASQPSWTKRFGSSAAGRYQFVRETLFRLKKELGLDGSLLFDANLQDRLGYRLLVRRGYEDFVARRITLNNFALKLAQEWASLPVLETMKGAKRIVSRGQSYYESDGLNHARVDPNRFEETLKSVLALAKGAPNSLRKPEVPMAQPTSPVTLPGEEAKPWYASKGIIGGILAMATPLISLFFPAARLVDPSDATDWIMKAIQIGGPIIGGLLATTGRYTATQPIKGSAADKERQLAPFVAPPQANHDMMALPVHQVLAQLPELLEALQKIQAATGTMMGEQRLLGNGAAFASTDAQEFAGDREEIGF